jgi:hypothetical protein
MAPDNKLKATRCIIAIPYFLKYLIYLKLLIALTIPAPE